MDIEKIISQLVRDSLATDEQETTLNMTGDERDKWYAWSNDPILIRRLAKIGAELYAYDVWGVGFTLDKNQVRFFQPMSDEQRQKLAARLITE